MSNTRTDAVNMLKTISQNLVGYEKLPFREGEGRGYATYINLLYTGRMRDMLLGQVDAEPYSEYDIFVSKDIREQYEEDLLFDTLRLLQELNRKDLIEKLVEYERLKEEAHQ